MEMLMVNNWRRLQLNEINKLIHRQQLKILTESQKKGVARKSPLWSEDLKEKFQRLALQTGLI